MCRPTCLLHRIVHRRGFSIVVRHHPASCAMVGLPRSCSICFNQQTFWHRVQNSVSLGRPLLYKLSSPSSFPSRTGLVSFCQRIWQSKYPSSTRLLSQSWGRRRHKRASILGSIPGGPALCSLCPCPAANALPKHLRPVHGRRRHEQAGATGALVPPAHTAHGSAYGSILSGGWVQALFDFMASSVRCLT